MVSDVSVHYHQGEKPGSKQADMVMQTDLRVLYHGLPAAEGDCVHSGYTMSI